MTAAGYTPCGQAPKTLGRKRRQSVGPQPLIANFTRLLHLGEPNDPDRSTTKVPRLAMPACSLKTP